jgi:uncharacterized protein
MAESFTSAEKKTINGVLNREMKFSLNLWAAFAMLLLATALAQPQTAQSPLPQPTGYVNDYAGVVDSATKQQLETTLGKLDRQQQIQFAVVTVDTTGDRDIFDYSLAVARGWGIGAKDTQKASLLLLVAIKDRKYFTQVSRHLEGDLPDGLVGQIQREHLVPAFRAGQYGQGLNDTINEYIATVARKEGFSPDTVSSGTSTPARERSSRGNTSFCAPLIIVVLVIVVLAVFVRRTRGPGNRGGPGSSWLPWLLLSLFLNSGRRSGSSGWSGGGFGGFGGGSSGGGFGGGGFGGFGGGGDFGGGGAGGSW